MKTARRTSFVFLLIASLTSSTIQVMAQHNQNKQSTLFENIERVNGNEMIERLGNQKTNFNKKYRSGNLPKAEYIFSRNNLTIISFNGLDYYVKNNRVVGIQGLELSDEVLNQITEKLVTLDSVQHSNSEKANFEYYNANVDIQKIRNIDRQFMASLKMLASTTRDIAALTKTENPSLNVENNIAKMRLPNVDKAYENQISQTLVQLNK
ncbi:hypothetical protein [Pedobacter miscanthi]|nr:hypothetical protein [Pedobacter miscanthi]